MNHLHRYLHRVSNIPTYEYCSRIFGGHLENGYFDLLNVETDDVNKEVLSEERHFYRISTI